MILCIRELGHWVEKSNAAKFVSDMLESGYVQVLIVGAEREYMVWVHQEFLPNYVVYQNLLSGNPEESQPQ